MPACYPHTQKRWWKGHKIDLIVVMIRNNARAQAYADIAGCQPERLRNVSEHVIP